MQAKLEHTSADDLTLDYEPLHNDEPYSLIQGAIRLRTGVDGQRAVSAS